MLAAILVDRLRTAVKHNDIKEVEAALKAGASPDVLLSPGGQRSLLAHAVTHQLTALIHILLAAGASVCQLGHSSRDAPWRLAMEGGDVTTFLEFLRCHPGLGSPSFGLSSTDEPVSSSNPWAVAVLLRNKIVLSSLVEAACSSSEKIPDDLVPLLAQEVVNLEASDGLLSALKNMSPNPSLFIEHVAWASCRATMQSSKAERLARGARVWAMEQGATCTAGRIVSWRTPKNWVDYGTESSEVALTWLPLVPFKSNGSAATWLALRGSTCPPAHLLCLLYASVEAGKAQVFRAVWDVMRKRGLEHTDNWRPLLHRAVRSAFRRDSSGGLALIRTVVEAKGVSARDDGGNTVLHELVRCQPPRGKGVPWTAGSRRLFYQAVNLVVSAGAQWTARNIEGADVAGFARQVEAPDEVVALAEKALMAHVLPAASPSAARRCRM